MFSALSLKMGASEGLLPLALKAERGKSSEIPVLRRFDTLNDEAEGVAAGIRELEVKGVRLRDQAVLCRTNARLNDIACALEARGIPVLHLGSLFERDEVRDLEALLSLAVDPFGDALVRVASLSHYQVPLQDVYLALRSVRNGKGPALGRLGELSTLEGLSQQGIAGFERLALDLGSLLKQRHAWDFLTSYLLDLTDLGRKMASAITVSERMRNVAVWQFLNFLRITVPSGLAHPFSVPLIAYANLCFLQRNAIFGKFRPLHFT